jgi:hypothetical protein
VKPVLAQAGNGNPGAAVDTGLHRYDELISGTGNGLAHGYMDVDLDIVWAIVSCSAWCSSPRRKNALKVKNTFNKGPAAARCSIKENLEGRGVAEANPVFALTVAIKRIWAIRPPVLIRCNSA